MRPGQNNFKNRNRNRNRRHGGGNGGGGGGGNPGNRVLDSNGPDVKLRGTAQTIAEKYMQLARDAASSGDRVMAESYYQHADHYYRLWLAAQPAGQPIQFSRRLDEDVEELDGAGEGEDEATEGSDAAAGEAADAAPGEGGAAPEGEAAAGDDTGQGQRNFRPRDNQPREQGNRDQQGGRERFRNRWPRRGDRNQEPREGAALQGEAGSDDSERADRPERQERSDRMERGERNDRPPRRERSDEAAPAEANGGDWEAPSFLKRPVPAVGNGSDGEAADAAPSPERRPRGRRPRYGEEGVTPNEPVTDEK